MKVDQEPGLHLFETEVGEQLRVVNLHELSHGFDLYDNVHAERSF